jgi:catechol 2,3-dioxygenase-like lactoylglutathione lyase family enzyme
MRKTVLGSITVFTRDVASSTGFYRNALGLKIVFQNKALAELSDYRGLRIFLQQAQGYSDRINFVEKHIALLATLLY